MNLISNLGKFRAIRLSNWPSKVTLTTIDLTENEFQRRYRDIFKKFFQPFVLPDIFQSMGEQ